MGLVENSMRMICYIIYILLIFNNIFAHRLIAECWNENPAKRPTFRQIITKLESIYNTIGQKRRWKVINSLHPPPSPDPDICVCISACACSEVCELG